MSGHEEGVGEGLKLPGLELPGLGDASDVHFSEPWQAQVFALTVCLNENEQFTWDEWAEVFSRHLASPDANADGSDYFHLWADALVELLETKDVSSAQAIAEMAETWKRAAHNTPHGAPILLENADQA